STTHTPSTSRGPRSSRTRSGRTSRTGTPSSPRSTTRGAGCSVWSPTPRTPTRTRWSAPSPRTWGRRTRSSTPRSACTSGRRPAARGSRARPCRTRTSAGWGRTGPRASSTGHALAALAARGPVRPHPYFGGVGPDRTACIECGECMTGCRHGAKNTLMKNYLGLAERAGARVVDRTTVSGLRERGDGTWEVALERTGAWTPRGKRAGTMTAGHVGVAAGTWGTQHLLHYAKDAGSLPRMSSALGKLTRTNSESILGAMRSEYKPEQDFSEGVAITSSFHPRSDPHVEPVRYGKGSNA